MKKLLILCALLFQISCALTSALWNDSYDETFKDFLVSQDGRYVVFLGHEYSYVLADDLGIMKEILAWKERNLLFINIDKTNFVVDHRNQVKGYVIIECVYNNITPDQEIFLKSMGFRGKGHDPLSLKLELRGVRYQPLSDSVVHAPAKLNRTYIISVHQQPGFGKRVGEVALTPITVVADSVLLFGKILLLPFSD